MRALFVTDDRFTSDIWNGELPVRVLLGQLVARGELPSWTSQIGSGFPLATITQDPITLGLFALLPPAAALDTLLLFWVLLAAHSTYALCRRLGTTRAGAVLAGNAFAVSGYMVCQLKHLGIISTVVWLPLGLLLLHRGLAEAQPTVEAPTRGDFAQRSVSLVLFGLVFGEQVLGGFPQSAYICALTYGAFALCCALSVPHAQGTPLSVRLGPLMAAGLTALLGAALGAVNLLSLHELGQLSDRGAGNTWEWATQLRYAPADFFTFLLPYINGDASDATYRPGMAALFPEDYGYVGVCTFLLAIYGAVSARQGKLMLFFAGAAVFAYLLVLGPATPLFRVAFEIIPGLKFFRCPTRFLIVVELALCVLAARGLSRAQQQLSTWLTRSGSEHVAAMLAVAMCAVTALDLLIHQPRQNPMVHADAWLAPPYTVQMIRKDSPDLRATRVFAPFRMEFHLAASRASKGYQDVGLYHKLRDLVEPNANLFWNVAVADCYAGISPRDYIDVWGDHNRGPLLMYEAVRPNWKTDQLDSRAAFVPLMRAYGVSHVVSPFKVQALEPALPMSHDTRHEVRVYRVEGASRVRVVKQARHVQSNQEAVAVLTAPGFDPNETLTLHDAPAVHASTGAPTAPPTAAASTSADSATILYDRGADLAVRATAKASGFLLLADNFYPGWQATVDGEPAPIYRANISVRAVPLAPGTHDVRFHFAPASLRVGLLISVAALCALLVALASALTVSRRSRH